MQHTTSDLTVTLQDMRDGHRYFIAITGATTAASLEFQHAKGGAWFVHPEFVATPSAGGVIFNSISCFVPRMRVSVAAGQVTPWTVTWVKQVTDHF